MESLAQSTVNASIEPFLCKSMGNELGEKWQQWLRHFKLMIEIKQISDATMKKALLLYCAGQQVQEVYDALPTDEGDDTDDTGDVFKTAVRVLSAHFIKKKNVTFERHIFRGLQQGPTEKIEQFILRLRQQAMKCNFGTQSNDNIKDQFIEKCLSTELKTKILDKGDALSLNDAVQLGITFESVQEQLMAMKSTGNSLGAGSHEAQVNRVQYDKQKWAKQKSGECRKCGLRGHDGGDRCPAIKKTCNICRKVGHFAVKCFQKKTGDVKRPTSKSEPPEKRRKDDENIHTVVDTESLVRENKYIFCMEAEAASDDNETWCRLGGVKTKAIVDSGSKYNLIDIDSWNWLTKHNVQVENMRCGADRVFRAYGGHKLDIRGTLETNLTIGTSSMKVAFYVMNEKGKILIGSDTAKKMKVLNVGIAHINTMNKDTSGVRNKPKPLNKIKDVLIRIPIDESITPVQQRYRRTPVALEEAANRKIQEMLDRDIIEKIEEGPAEWISPMVVVPKSDGDVRICVDMREPNRAVKREKYPMPTFDEILPHIARGKVFSKLDVEQAFLQMELHPDSRYITTFMTKVGLCRFKRLNFGISCAPEMFQRRMEIILLKCKGTCTLYCKKLRGL